MLKISLKCEKAEIKKGTYLLSVYRVLIPYLCPHFQRIEKPKGGPLEIENFFVEGGLRKGLERGQEPSKNPLRLYNQQI